MQFVCSFVNLIKGFFCGFVTAKIVPSSRPWLPLNKSWKLTILLLFFLTLHDKCIWNCHKIIKWPVATCDGICSSVVSSLCGFLDRKCPVCSIFFYFLRSTSLAASGLVVRVLGYRSGGPGSIPGTTEKKSSGSGTGFTQPREYNWGATWQKSSGSCLENREYGRRDPSRWPRGTLYLHKLAITSLTSGGRSVGIVHSRTQTI
jgi:hypothetical protein